MSISEETLLQAREEAETGNDQYSRGFVSAVITELLEARKEIEAAKAVYAGGETEAHALEPSDSGACTQSRDGDARIPNPPVPTGHLTDPFCIHGEYLDHQCPKCEDYPVWRATREAEADELREKMKCLDSQCAEQPVELPLHTRHLDQKAYQKALDQAYTVAHFDTERNIYMLEGSVRIGEAAGVAVLTYLREVAKRKVDHPVGYTLLESEINLVATAIATYAFEYGLHDSIIEELDYYLEKHLNEYRGQALAAIQVIKRNDAKAKAEQSPADSMLINELDKLAHELNIDGFHKQANLIHQVIFRIQPPEREISDDKYAADHVRWTLTHYGKESADKIEAIYAAGKAARDQTRRGTDNE